MSDFVKAIHVKSLDNTKFEVDVNELRHNDIKSLLEKILEEVKLCRLYLQRNDRLY